MCGIAGLLGGKTKKAAKAFNPTLLKYLMLMQDSRGRDNCGLFYKALNEDKDLLRVFIDDPGRGHAFDLISRLNQLGEQSGKHLGLGIFQHLSDEFQIDNKGTSLVFDFEVNPKD